MLRVRSAPLGLPLGLPLALMIAGALLSALAAYDPRLSVGWLAALLIGAGLYASAALIARTSARVAQLAAGLALAGAALGLYITIQYRYLQWSEAASTIAQAGGLLSQLFPELPPVALTPNVVAATLIGALPVAVGLAVAARGLLRGLWVASASVMLLALVLSESRGAWAGLVLAGLIGAAAVLRRRGARPPDLRRLPVGVLVVGAAGLALLALAVGLALPRALPAAQSRMADQLELWRNSFYLALEFPFSGVGGGTPFAMTYAVRQLIITVPFVNAPHTLFLSVWLAHGLLGLVGLCAMLLGSARLIVRALPQLTPPGLGAAVGALATLLHSLLDAPQYDQWPALLMAFAVVGLAVGAARTADARPLVWLRPGRRGWLALGLAAALALGLSWQNLAARASANLAAVLHTRSSLTMADTPERAAAYERARAWADYGLQFDGRNPAALRARAMVDVGLRRYEVAIAALEVVVQGAPRDQGALKSLGYSYIWLGLPERGVPLLQRLDRSDEARSELNTWQIAWAERGRPEMVERALVAAAVWDGAP